MLCFTIRERSHITSSGREREGLDNAVTTVIFILYPGIKLVICHVGLCHLLLINK